MKSLFATGAALALLCLGASASAQGPAYGSPSLLPIPEAGPQAPGYPANTVTPAGAALASSPYFSSLAGRQPDQMPVPGRGAEVIAPHGAAPSVYDEALAGGWGEECCSAPATCCGTWFGSIAGAVITRDNPNKFWTTYETNNNVNQLLNTRDAEADWRAGGEVRVGRWFAGCPCTGLWGIEASYFIIDPMEGFASIRDVSNNLSTPINLNTQTGTVNIGATPAGDFFDNSREHRISRQDEVQDIEINFLRQQIFINSQSQATWLFGVRYFRFDEGLSFGAVAGGFEFGSNGGVNEAYLDIGSVNNLVGGQLGARFDHYVTPRVGFFVTPKVGIYGNDVSTRSRLYRGDGLVGFDIAGHKDDFSVLASLDIGMNYQFATNWRAFAGYRAIAVSGIALSDNQIPAYLAAADEFADPDTNGSLILHGGLAGLECRY